MSLANTSPTEAGFLAFVRGVMGITTAQLPDGDPALGLSYAVAVELVSLTLSQVSGLLYTQALYNLAGDNLVNYAQDPSGQTTFLDLREKFNINGFVSGVIQSTGDEATSTSLVVMDAAKNFTLADLQNLKTPWGRRYLSIAQQQGSLWGRS